MDERAVPAQNVCPQLCLVAVVAAGRRSLCNRMLALRRFGVYLLQDIVPHQNMGKHLLHNVNIYVVNYDSMDPLDFF
jgi:hypothetical protein